MLLATFQHLWNRDSVRRSDELYNMRMYANKNIAGTEAGNYWRVQGDTDGERDGRMKLNVAKAVVDTATSRIAKTRPRATFLTSGGNHSLRKKAQGMERFVSAVMRNNQMIERSPRVFVDSTVGGTGCWAVLKHCGEIKIERVYTGEIIVDAAESMYGDPRNMYRIQYVDRNVLIAMFPEHKAQIKKADNRLVSEEGDYPVYDSTADQVQVVTGYHLPSGKDKGDGRICIAISGATLSDDEWNHDWFPFVFLRWTDRQLGFWGNGAIDEIRGIQTEISRLLNLIAKSQRRLGVPWILKEEGSKVENAHLDNAIGTIVSYRGTPPIVQANNSVAPDWIAQLNWLYQRAFEITGVSAPSSSGVMPAGLTSGVAIREWSDVETARFSIVAQQYEQAHVELAKRIVALGKELSETDSKFHIVASKDKYTVETIKWSEIEMPEDSYTIEVFPTSSLPSHPAGRLAAVQELINAGMITPERGKQMLGFPDLEEEESLDRAARDAIDMAVESMLDKGIYIGPEPFDDLELAMKVVQSNYNKARQRGDVPDERLQLLRNYLTSASNMIFKAKAEADRMAQMQAANQMGAGVTGSPQQGAPLPVNPDGSQPGALNPSDTQ